MNDLLIKNLIKYKLNTVSKMMDLLPPKMTEEIKAIGRLVLEGINEGLQDNKAAEPVKSKDKSKLDNITIE